MKGSLNGEGRERWRSESRSRRRGLTALLKLGGKQMVGWQTKKQS